MVERFAIATDTACDLPLAVLGDARVEVLGFPYVMGDDEFIDDMGVTLPFSSFYERLREGSVSRTAQVPIPTYLGCFESNARAGIPTLFLSFSSELSGTCETARTIAARVSEEHPEAPITFVNTRSASIAQGLVVLEAVRLRDAGSSIEETAHVIEALIPRVNGFFTLESLEFLARGGRIPDALAKATTMLDVRPLLQFSPEGALSAGMPQRGRRRALKTLVARVAERAALEESGRVLVGHAQSEADALTVEEAVRELPGVTEVVRCEIGPVIGSHVGPGMVAVAFIGTERGA